MQATDKPDEEGTVARNFRPSSNFMFMKKYRKGNPHVEPAESQEEQSKDAAAAKGKESNVQPPLPRGPPPPSPPLVKKELEEEDEYVISEVEDNEAPSKKRTMCRQFARGYCTRGDSCIYAHEIIISQLADIYTFCRDYQNSTCNFPRCKFVHATVFEKENFYRTGYLPPHALAHLKESTPNPAASAAPPPPPPPPPPPVLPPPPPALQQNAPEGTQPELPLTFPTPTALTHSPGSVLLGCAAGEVRPSAAALALAAAVGAPCNHEPQHFSELVAAATREPARADTAFRPLKCPHCDLLTFRRSCLRMKKEKLLRSIRDHDVNLTMVEQKKDKQQTMMWFAAKPSGGGSSEVQLFTPKPDNSRNEHERSLVERLSTILSSPSGFSLPVSSGYSTAAAFGADASSPFAPSQTFPPSFSSSYGATPGYSSTQAFTPPASYSSASSYGSSATGFSAHEDNNRSLANMLVRLFMSSAEADS